jgi:hypothetical protein
MLGITAKAYSKSTEVAGWLLLIARTMDMDMHFLLESCNWVENMWTWTCIFYWRVAIGLEICGHGHAFSIGELQLG